jgi:hypothetical protein
MMASALPPAVPHRRARPAGATPYCSQCRISMRLDRIEPGPASGLAVETFRCGECGLLDQVRSRAAAQGPERVIGA